MHVDRKQASCEHKDVTSIELSLGLAWSAPFHPFHSSTNSRITHIKGVIGLGNLGCKVIEFYQMSHEPHSWTYMSNISNPNILKELLN